MKLDFSKSKILVIGDLMLDSFFYGESKRISPEAPVPVIHKKNLEFVLGGAANVCNNIVALSSNASIIGVLGDDKEGEIILNLLSENKIFSKNVFIDKKFSTILKERILSNKIQIARIDREDDSYRFKFSNDHIRKIEKEIKSNDIIILSDYNKGFLTNGMISKIIKICSANNKKIIVDPKKNSLSSYKGADIITPNLKEIQCMTGINIRNDIHLVEICKELIIKNNLNYIIVTKSEKGISVIGNGVDYHFEAKEISHPDVSGAGDTVIAALSLCLSINLTVEESVRIANLAASIVVNKVGTSTVSKNELESII